MLEAAHTFPGIDGSITKVTTTYVQGRPCNLKYIFEHFNNELHNGFSSDVDRAIILIILS